MNPKIVDEFVSNKFKEYLKIYLVLKYKGYSWKGELQNSFSIADSVVNEGLKVLEKEGFLISKDFWSLDLDMQEAIRRLNSGYFSKINSYPKIYILNQDEAKEMWYELNKDEIKKLIKGDGSMTHTLNLAEQKKKAFEKTQNLFNEIENKRLERERFDDSGIFYITDTKRKKMLANDIKLGLSELSKLKIQAKEKNKFLSDNSKKNQLVKNKDDLILRDNIENNGNLSSQKDRALYNETIISSADFENKMNEIDKSRKEDLKLEKELELDKKILQQIEKFRDKGENVPQVLGFGQNQEEINNEMKKRLDDWDVFLGVRSNSNKSQEKQLIEKFDILVEKLKSKKYLDVFFALDFLGSKNNLNEFQEYIKELPISFDGDDFRYNV